MILRKLEIFNKKSFFIIIVATILISIIIVITINQKTPIQRKFIGFWNIEFDNCMIGNSDINLYGSIIYVKNKDSLELPPICCDKPILIAMEEAVGTWETININPDSIFFNVPDNPLHGKYAIRFFIDKNGYRNEYFNINQPNNIYKIELQNDSVYMICNKGGIMNIHDVRDWEGKN